MGGGWGDGGFWQVANALAALAVRFHRSFGVAFVRSQKPLDTVVPSLGYTRNQLRMRLYPSLGTLATKPGYICNQP